MEASTRGDEDCPGGVSSQRYQKAMVLDAVRTKWDMQSMSCGQRYLEATVPFYDIVFDVQLQGGVPFPSDNTEIEYEEDGFIVLLDQRSPEAIEFKGNSNDGARKPCTAYPTAYHCSPMMPGVEFIFDLRNYLQQGEGFLTMPCQRSKGLQDCNLFLAGPFQRSRWMVELDRLYDFDLQFVGNVFAPTLHYNLFRNEEWSNLLGTGRVLRALGEVRFPHRLSLILLGSEVFYSFCTSVGHRALDGVHFPHQLDFIFRGGRESYSFHAGVTHRALDGVLFPHHLDFIFHGDKGISSFRSSEEHRVLEGVRFPPRLSSVFLYGKGDLAFRSSVEHRALDGVRFPHRFNLVFLCGKVTSSFRTSAGHRALDGVRFPHQLDFIFHGGRESSSFHAGVAHRALDGILFPHQLDFISHGDKGTSSFHSSEEHRVLEGAASPLI